MAQLKLRKRQTTRANKITVSHPSHYNVGSMEVMDAIEGLKLNFYSGNILKYIARAGHKEVLIKDLLKALWYLQRWVACEKLSNGMDLTEEEKKLFRNFKVYQKVLLIKNRLKVKEVS